MVFFVVTGTAIACGAGRSLYERLFIWVMSKLVEVHSSDDTDAGSILNASSRSSGTSMTLAMIDRSTSQWLTTAMASPWCADAAGRSRARRASGR